VNLQIFDDEPTLAQAAAHAITRRLRDEPRTVLGLPTGRTPIAVYAHLIADTTRDRIDWSIVRTFNLDEFVGLPADHDASYQAFMRRHLFAHVNIQPAHVQFPDGMAADLHAECRRYDEAIRAAGGIDLQVLGIGGNGHIGFNEPAEHLEAWTHRVTLHPDTRAANAGWFGGDVALVPAEALSVGMASILTARQVLLLATGEEKAEAMAGAIEGPITTRLPASFLQLHANTTVMIDRAAASRLTRSESAPFVPAGRRAAP
jgi:glucosamine-6-phosphate deaminase